MSLLPIESWFLRAPAAWSIPRRRMRLNLRCAVLLCAVTFAVSAWSSLAFAAGAAKIAASEVAVTKQRLIVLSDIEADPDDLQSFVRLLLYSNEIDIEAMIATTSIHMQTQIHPESIRRLIGEYAKVEKNLLRHANGYPSAAMLHARVAAGQHGYGMAAVGEGKDTDGSTRIVRALREKDARALWVAVWGGANTLAQALYRIRQDESPDRLARARLEAARLHDFRPGRQRCLDSQDVSGAVLHRKSRRLRRCDLDRDPHTRGWHGQFDHQQ